jgi:hypothetical protein
MPVLDSMAGALHAEWSEARRHGAGLSSSTLSCATSQYRVSLGCPFSYRSRLRARARGEPSGWGWRAIRSGDVREGVQFLHLDCICTHPRSGAPSPAALRDGFASGFGWLGDVLPEPFQGRAQDARDVHLRYADPLRDLMLSQVLDEP